MDEIDTIVIFAAGYGKRMEHLTSSKPKSLIMLNGIPLLYRVLNLVLSYPFQHIIINTHYYHKQIEEAVEQYKLLHKIKTKITLVYEPEILETGGAIKNIYPLIGDKSIFTCNSDMIIEADCNIFKSLLKVWDSSLMNFLLLLKSVIDAQGYNGTGDFNLTKENKVYRDSLSKNHEYMYTGVSIIKPFLVQANPESFFSLKTYYFDDEKVYGHCIASSKWYHASTPNDVATIEKTMRDR